MPGARGAWRAVRGLPWRLRRAYRRYGLAGAARKGVRLLTSVRTRRRAAARAREFDVQYGVETAGIVRLGGLRIASENRDLGVRYQPSEPAAVRELIDALAIDHSAYVFVDYGSGKGRVLLVASEFPFKRIVGVEFSPELNEIARENLARFPRDRQRCSEIELVTADAAEYELPAEPAVLYFYNPFAEPVLRRVLTAVQESLGSHPRPVLLLFTGDLPRPELLEDAGLVRVEAASAGLGRAIFAAGTPGEAR